MAECHTTIPPQGLGEKCIVYCKCPVFQPLSSPQNGLPSTLFFMKLDFTLGVISEKASKCASTNCFNSQFPKMTDTDVCLAFSPYMQHTPPKLKEEKQRKRKKKQSSATAT